MLPKKNTTKSKYKQPKKSIKKPKKKHEPKMIGNGFWICFSPEKPGFPGLFSRDVAASIAPTLNEIDCLACHVRWARLKYPGWKMDIYLPGCSWTHGIWMSFYTNFHRFSHLLTKNAPKKRGTYINPPFLQRQQNPFSWHSMKNWLINRDLIVMLIIF